MSRMNRRLLAEEKHRVKMKKVKKKWVTVGMTTFMGVALATFSSETQVDASEWRATTVEEMKARVKVEDGKYTFQSGDTFWAVGQAINIKAEKLMELNGFAPGSQYSVPVGTVIYWDGDNVTVKDTEGNIIAQETIQPADKIDPAKPVGSNSTNTVPSTSTGNTTANQANVSNSDPGKANSGGNTGNSGGSNQGNSGGNNGQGNSGQGQGSGQEQPTPTPNPNPSNPDPVDPEPTPEPQPEQTELEKLKARLAELQAQLVVAKAELAQAEADLSNAQSATSKEEIEAEIANLQSIINVSESTIATKQTEIASIDSQLTVANNELSVAQATANNAQSALSTAQANTANANTALANAQAALAENPEDPALQAQVANAQAQVDAAMVEQATAESALSNATNDVSAKQQAVDNINASKAGAEQELSNAQSQINQAQDQIAQLEEQLNNLGNTDLSALEAKVAEKAQKVADIEAEIAKIEEKIAELEGQQKPEPPVIVDKSALQTVINDVNATDTTVYTEESVAALNSALATANQVLSNEGATQEQVNQAVSELQSALSNLVEKPQVPIVVDKSGLEALVSSVEATDFSIYTDDSVNVCQSTINEAKAVLANPMATQAEVDQALSVLQSAFNNLVEKPVEVTVDKSALQSLVNSVSELDTSFYTEESVYALRGALNVSNQLLDNENATQAEVDAMTASLQSALDGLVEKPSVPSVNKDALTALVNQVRNTDLSNMTDTTKEAFEQALANAQQVLANTDATQAQVDTALSVLQQAHANLEEKIAVDKSALETLVSTVEGLDTSNYTDESVQALTTQLNVAKALLGQADATQAQIDAMTTSLQEAVNNLVEKPEVPQVNKDALNALVNNVANTDLSNKTDSSKQAFEQALANAQAVIANDSATQAQVDTALSQLQTAFDNLEENVTEEEKIKEVQETVNKGTVDLWNDYRQANGKTVTSNQENLQKAADIRAREIAELFDHVRPDGRDIYGENKETGEWGDSLAYEAGFLQEKPYPGIPGATTVSRDIYGENLAQIKGVSLEWIQENGAQFAFESWKNSTDHNEVMLTDGETRKYNQGAIGTYIEKNDDGTYNVHYVLLIGFDTNL